MTSKILNVTLGILTVAQRVKDLALLQLWHSLQVWVEFWFLAWELICAVGAAKKEKKILLLIGHFHLPILTASRLWVQKVWERELLKYLFSFTGGSSSSPRDEAGCGFALKWCSCVLLVLIFFLTRAKLYSSEGIECSTTLGGRDDGGGGRGVHRDTASLSYSVWSSADALAVTRGLKTSLWCAALSRACEDMRRQPKKMLLLSNPQMTYY